MKLSQISPEDHREASVRVLFPYVKHFPKARIALEIHTPKAEAVDVSGGWHSYWDAIASRWGKGDDLLIVEHDIVLGPGMVEGFTSCSNPWCLHPYQITPELSIDWALGCTRFRAELQERVPIEAISALNPPGMCENCAGSRKCWFHIDVLMAWSLIDAGQIRCVHSPKAEHLRVIESASPDWMPLFPR